MFERVEGSLERQALFNVLEQRRRKCPADLQEQRGKEGMSQSCNLVKLMPSSNTHPNCDLDVLEREPDTACEELIAKLASSIDERMHENHVGCEVKSYVSYQRQSKWGSTRTGLRRGSENLDDR